MTKTLIKNSICWILTGLLLSLILGSCGRLIVGGNPTNTPTVNFDYFADAVRQNYSFFVEKQVSWDSLERQYRPLVHDRMGNDSLYAIFSEMLGTLRDGHVNFYTDFDRSRNHDFIYDYPANYDGELVVRNYVGKDYYSTGGFLHDWLPDSVGYVHYGSFGNRFTGRQLSFVLNRYSEGRGLILDLRSNGGGAMSRMYTLVRRFLSEPTHMGMMQYKNGPGPEDFSTLDSINLKPTVDFSTRSATPDEKADEAGERAMVNAWSVSDSTGVWQDKPLVILVGRRTYSAANFCAALLSTLPNVTLIGDRTGGGGGVPVSFELPNGWKFRLSATRTYLPDGTDIEDGIEPDIYQATGYREALEGRDAVLERALDLLAGR